MVGGNYLTFITAFFYFPLAAFFNFIFFILDKRKIYFLFQINSTVYTEIYISYATSACLLEKPLAETNLH